MRIYRAEGSGIGSSGVCPQIAVGQIGAVVEVQDIIFLVNADDIAGVFGVQLQDLLTLGNTVFPVAADDFHRYEHGIAGGWIMLGAKDLTYPDVIEAMEKGDFYASAGPEIKSLALEGTRLKIACSEAVSIKIRTHIRQAVQLLPENGHTMTKAEFDLAPWLKKWETLENKEQAFIRVTVTDAAGHKALTRAYFLGELL